MGQEVSNLVDDVGKDVERIQKVLEDIQKRSEKRFSDSQKSSIKMAIWKVYENADTNTSPKEYEILLLKSLKNEFLYNQCSHEPTIGIYTPDIVVEDVGVFEVKSRPWKNLNSTEKERIKLYVEELKLPGVFVNFSPNDKLYVRWYYLDENGSAVLERNEIKEHPSIEYSYESSSFSSWHEIANEISDSDSDSDEEKSVAAYNYGQSSTQTQNSYTGERSRSYQNQESSSGLSTGAAIGIGVAAVAAAGAIGFTAYRESERREQERQRQNSSKEMDDILQRFRNM